MIPKSSVSLPRVFREPSGLPVCGIRHDPMGLPKNDDQIVIKTKFKYITNGVMCIPTDVVPGFTLENESVPDRNPPGILVFWTSSGFLVFQRCSGLLVL